jgi:hypothetical protein
VPAGDAYFLNRGIITHLLNSLGMLADHHVIDIGWGAFGFVGCQEMTLGGLNVEVNRCT